MYKKCAYLGLFASLLLSGVSSAHAIGDSGGTYPPLEMMVTDDSYQFTVAAMAPEAVAPSFSIAYQKEDDPASMSFHFDAGVEYVSDDRFDISERRNVIVDPITPELSLGFTVKRPVSDDSSFDMSLSYKRVSDDSAGDKALMFRLVRETGVK